MVRRNGGGNLAWSGETAEEKKTAITKGEAFVDQIGIIFLCPTQCADRMKYQAAAASTGDKPLVNKPASVDSSQYVSHLPEQYYDRCYSNLTEAAKEAERQFDDDYVY